MGGVCIVCCILRLNQLLFFKTMQAKVLIISYSVLVRLIANYIEGPVLKIC